MFESLCCILTHRRSSYLDINFSLHFNFFSLYTWCYITLKSWNSKKYYKFQIILYKGKKKIHLSYQVWLFNNFILSLLLMKVKVKVLVTQSCPTLCDPTNCSLPGFPVHGILLARALEWVAVTFFQGIFLTQGSILGVLHCRQILYHQSHQGSENTLFICI